MKHLVHHAKRHYHARYREPYKHLAHWVFMFDAALVAIVLALLGVGAYFAFVFHPLRDDFRFEVITPEKMVAGRETEVTIRISNQGERRLHNARVWAHFPKHFRISQFPKGHDPVTYTTPVGAIAPGETVDLKLRGTIFGPPGTETVFAHMIASDDKGLPDEKIFPIDVTWTENLFAVDIELPNSVVDGQAVHATIRLVNGTDHAFEAVRVAPKWPEGFRVLTSSPPFSQGEVVISPLASGEAVAIEISGRYHGAAGIFEASAVVTADEGGTAVLLAETAARRTSVATQLEFEAILPAATLTPGADVPFTVRYRNAGAYVLKDVVFEVPLDVRVADHAVSRSAFAAIPELKPGESGTLEGSVRLLSRFTQYVTDAKLVLTPDATFEVAEPAVERSTVSGKAAEAKIRGQAAVRGVARYYTSEGDQIGRGPLPPRVGKETRYWIFVSLEGGTNVLADGRMEIRLPEGVRWTGQTSVSAGDEPSFYPEERMALWEIGEVVPHAGVSSDAPTVSFEVALIPSKDQKGTAPALLNDVTFKAKDAWTGESIEAASGRLTTELPQDDYAKGRTKVQP